jgi:nitrogen-specific signal transduction histidine kinase
VRPDGRVIEVWDQGPGVAPEVEPRLFGPWVTTKEGGTGLGLAVSHRIVRTFGWSIAFHREGDRTVFRIHFPPTAEKEVSP